METDEKTDSPTTEPDPAAPPIAEALDSPNGANGRTVDVTTKPAKDERWKANLGNKNSQTRGGLWSLNRKRQKGLPVDRRTRWGKIERQIQNLLTAEYGGADKITTRQAILISLVGLDCARMYEHKRSRRLFIEKGKEAARKKGYTREQIALVGKSPKDLALMDGYMQPVITSLRSNLTALGPEPERQGEKLEDILTKIAEGETDESGGGGG